VSALVPSTQSSTVAGKSWLVTGVSMVAGATPGPVAMRGTRSPPSYSVPFPPRSGRGGLTSVGPLSEVKNSTVFDHTPSAWSVSTTRRVLWSRASTMAA
jgi:hypothetical protein